MTLSVTLKPTHGLMNSLLNYELNGVAFSRPASLYTGLLVSSGDNYTEVTGGNYARKHTTGWTTPAGGASHNTAAVSWVAPTFPTSQVAALGLWDGPARGKLLFIGTVAPGSIAPSGTLSFPVGGVVVSPDYLT